MTGLPNVTITIRQGENVIATVITNAQGQANTILNEGTYQVTFQAHGHADTTINVTVNEPNTAIIFAFPYWVSGGILFNSQANNAPLTALVITVNLDAISQANNAALTAFVVTVNLDAVSEVNCAPSITITMTNT